MHPTGPAAKALSIAMCALLAGCASTQRAPSPQDPWEGMNRATWEFNQVVDRGLVKPVAKAYVRFVPQFARTGVNNFLTNLGYTTTLVNNILQLKLLDAANDTARLVLNTTLGLAGLLDPATDAGLKRNDEDFGQTLGFWGMPSGPFLMLPLLGPSTLRDGPALVADYHTDVRSHLDNSDRTIDFAFTGLTIVNLRARLLPAEAALEGAYDRYALVRNAFLERREYQVRDGNVPERPADAGFSDEELDELEREMAGEDAGAGPGADSPEADADLDVDTETDTDAAFDADAPDATYEAGSPAADPPTETA